MITFNNQILEPILKYNYSENIAFHINGMDYTYIQLFNIVEQVYEIVSVLPEDKVCLYATDNIRTYATILALWFCGKSYVPLNPLQPRERHMEVIGNVKSNYILSSDDKYAVGIDSVHIISTNSLLVDGYKKKNNIKILDVPDSAIAYIIFTSGSTGIPKGVQISRRNLAFFVDSMHLIGLKITSNDRCLQPFDLTFDFSVSSYIIPLAKGASIFTVPNRAVKFTYIAGLLEEYKLTVLQMVPSMIRNLLPYLDEVKLDSVRYNILCGEVLTRNVIKSWHKGNHEMISYNMYGPTENTVFCTYYIIDINSAKNILAVNDIVSIGKTFKNNALLLLDENDRVITGPNVEGELCLSGPQLTLGYWENTKENAAKFFEIDNERYYRSGDMCYYAEDGNLMYVSRKDFQVKINGFRVELGEIEHTYSTISEGIFCVVIPYTNAQGNTELAIIIEGKEYDYNEHLEIMAKKIPAYELPNKWFFIKQIPLNVNGKVDRKQIAKTFNL